MNTFQQIWQNWAQRAKISQWPAPQEHASINELNQAIFKRLEKILPSNVKVRSVCAPVFLYYTEAAGGYGVDTHSGMVETHRILLPKDGTFEERVDAAVAQLDELIRGAGTVFFYMPVVPISEFNGHMMGVRLKKTGETVDIKELA